MKRATSQDGNTFVQISTYSHIPKYLLVIALGSHDRYVKGLLSRLFGSRYRTDKYYTYVEYVGGSAQIDGVIVFPEGDIAVEIESRTAKQVRGALLDLFFHRARKKLLIIVPEYMYSPQALKEDAEYILGELKKIRPNIIFKVVILKGSGNDPKPKEDAVILREAIEELRSSS